MFLVTRDAADDLYVDALRYEETSDGVLVFYDTDDEEVGRVKAETWDAVVRPVSTPEED